MQTKNISLGDNVHLDLNTSLQLLAKLDGDKCTLGDDMSLFGGKSGLGSHFEFWVKFVNSLEVCP